MTYKSLFEEFMQVKTSVQLLAGIVQNDVPEIPGEYFDEWINKLDETTNKLQALKIDVIDYYEEK